MSKKSSFYWSALDKSLVRSLAKGLTVVVAFCLVCVAVIGAPGPALAQHVTPPPIEKPNLTISIGTWVIQYLPLPIAVAKGYFKDESLHVTVQDFDAGGATALQSLLGGSSDLVVGFYDHTVQMQARHKDVRCVVLLNIVPGLVLAVRSDLDGQIRSVADLKGKTVGVTALGSSTEFQVRYLASRDGLSPSDITFIPVGSGPTAVAAIERKQIDAIMTQDPTYALLANRGLVRSLIDARTIEGSTTAFGGKYPTACVYTTGAFIDRYPGTVQHVVNAFVRSLQFIHNTPSEDIARALPSEYALGNPSMFGDVIHATKPMFPLDGRFDVNDLMRAHMILSTFDKNVASSDFVVGNTYTNRFVDAVSQNAK